MKAAAAPARPSPAWREIAIGVALLAAAVAFTYGHTLDAPFELDDASSILENEWIRPGHSLADLWRFAPLRVLGYLSFALNYRIGGTDPHGYHLVNIVVHFLASCATWAFARALLRTPRIEGTVTDHRVRIGVPLVAGLLFALHPLQSSAVTYVVQRLASMSALFYISSLACFVHARLARGNASRIAAAAGCVITGAMALVTKESTVTLPFALALIECVAFRHRAIGRVGVVFAGVAVTAAVWFGIALVFGRNPFAAGTVQALTSDAALLTRGQYLATQLPNLWAYARLFVWPAGLHLDHSDAHRSGFGEPVVMLAIAGHAAMIVAALWAARHRPWLGWGVLFWYLAHSVESSIFPLQDMMFEHRAYLPDLGLCLAASWLLAAELPRLLRSPRRAWGVTAALLVVLGVLTWRRNQMWRDPVALWEDNVRHAPDRARAWGSLARHLTEAKRPGEAVAALERSIQIGTQRGAVDPLDVVNLSIALQGLGRTADAETLVTAQLGRPMSPYAASLLWIQRGNLDYQAGRLGAAETAFGNALAHDTSSVPARANLASTWGRTGRLASAESLFAVVSAIDPRDLPARINLLQARAARLIDEAQRYGHGGKWLDARRSYESAFEALEELGGLEPGNPAAATNLTMIRQAISDLDSRHLRR